MVHHHGAEPGSVLTLSQLCSQPSEPSTGGHGEQGGGQDHLCLRDHLQCQLRALLHGGEWRGRLGPIRGGQWGWGGLTIPLSPQGINSHTNTPVETWTGAKGKQSYTYVVEKNATTSFTWAFQRTPYHEAVRAGGADPPRGRCGCRWVWGVAAVTGALVARAGDTPVTWPSSTLSMSPTCWEGWRPSATAVPSSQPDPAPRVPSEAPWNAARAPA